MIVFVFCFIFRRTHVSCLIRANLRIITKKAAMSALQWPVESITEHDARKFFERGKDMNFSGSWRFENTYTPKLRDVRRDGKCWSYRFKMYKRATLRPSNKIYQAGPHFVDCTSYRSREAAEARCYRDIYAKIHENASKFKSPKRKSTAADRELRATKRSARKDPAAAKQNEQNERTKDVGAEMPPSVAVRATARPSTVVVTPSEDISPGNVVPSVSTRASRRGQGAKTRQHIKNVQNKLAIAEQAIQDATDTVAQLRALYRSMEYCGDRTFSVPIQTLTAQDANDAAHTSEDESVHDNHPLPHETAMARATLSDAQARQLVYQIKCVCHCNLRLVKQWRTYADAVKSLRVGQRSPHVPTVTSSLHAVIKQWQEEPPEMFSLEDINDRRSGRTKPIHHVDTMRKWVTHWNNTKSFKIASFNCTSERS